MHMVNPNLFWSKSVEKQCVLLLFLMTIAKCIIIIDVGRQAVRLVLLNFPTILRFHGRRGHA